MLTSKKEKIQVYFRNVEKRRTAIHLRGSLCRPSIFLRSYQYCTLRRTISEPAMNTPTPPAERNRPLPSSATTTPRHNPTHCNSVTDKCTVTQLRDLLRSTVNTDALNSQHKCAQYHYKRYVSMFANATHELQVHLLQIINMH